MFEHLTPLPSTQVPDLNGLQDGFFGTLPHLIPAPEKDVYLVPGAAPLTVPRETNTAAVVAGHDVALLRQNYTAFENFSIFEQRTNTETPRIDVAGLFTLNNLQASGSSGIDGAFAFLCNSPDKQVLVVAKRGADGVWSIAHQQKLEGHSQCLSMESPERLWMSRIAGNLDRKIHRKSTLQEFAVVKGVFKATKIKIAFPETTILAASAGGTFFFHDKTGNQIHVYDSGVKTAELDVPGGDMIFRYASAPDRVVVHGIQTKVDGEAYIMGFRRENGAFVRWFEHTTPKVDYIAISGDTLWHSGAGKRWDVYRADL